MIKKYLLVIGTLLFISCKDNGVSFVGTYKNKSKYLIIEKVGDDKFMIKSDLGNGEYASFAEYKNGCFIIDTPKGPKDAFCKTEFGLVSHNGIEFKK